jgi:AMMECR1 domain-containing protein
MTLFLLLSLAIAGAPAAPPRSPGPMLQIARLALQAAVRGEPAPVPAAAELERPGAAFVTVVLDGATRACQGSLLPTAATLGEEIIAAATRAARGDGRHPSLSAGELDRARIVVSLPYDVRPRAAGQAVDPRRFGLAVETANAAGVLLPGEARTFEWMLRETRRRAGATSRDPGRELIFLTVVIGEQSLPALETR